RIRPTRPIRSAKDVRVFSSTMRSWSVINFALQPFSSGSSGAACCRIVDSSACAFGALTPCLSRTNTSSEAIMPLLWTQSPSGKGGWHPDIARKEGIPKLPRHDTDDGVALSGERDTLSDDARFSAKPPLPEVKTDDSLRFLLGQIFIGTKR